MHFFRLTALMASRYYSGSLTITGLPENRAEYFDIALDQRTCGRNKKGDRIGGKGADRVDGRTGPRPALPPSLALVRGPPQYIYCTRHDNEVSLPPHSAM